MVQSHISIKLKLKYFQQRIYATATVREMGNKCGCTGKKSGETFKGPTFGDERASGDRIALVEGTNPLVQKIHQRSEFDAVLKEAAAGGKLVVADFYAPWCGPCQLLSPKVDKFADEFVDKVIFAKINVDDNDELASSYGISCMPTFIIFLKGEKVEEISGANIDKLRQLIVKHTEK